MACNSSSQALTSKDPQGHREEVGATSLISEYELQEDRNTPTVSTFSRNPDSHKRQAGLGGVGELPNSCGFLNLARELRDMVYVDLITSGQVQILRVSQQLHDEAKDLLYQKGICRLRMDCFIFDTPKLRDPTTILSNDKIRNFNIHMSIHDWLYQTPNRFKESDPSFVHSIQGSGNCHISLFYSHVAHLPIQPKILNFIGCLRNFELVTLRIHGESKPVVEPCHTTLLQSVAASLRSALGNPDWKLDTCSRGQSLSDFSKVPSHESQLSVAQYLEFHPREKE